MSQPRLHSAAESLCNVAVGYFVALASQLVILPAYGVNLPLRSNLAIGLWFTAVSIVRSYALRRWFNRIHPRTRSHDCPRNQQKGPTHAPR